MRWRHVAKRAHGPSRVNVGWLSIGGAEGGGGGCRVQGNGIHVVVPQNEQTFCFSNSRYGVVSQQLGPLILLSVAGMELSMAESVAYNDLLAVVVCT
jgi:hypothetical protein